MSFAKYSPDGRVQHTPGAVDDSGKLLNAGFDETEGVQKVATLVWNASSLQWERAAGGPGGSGGSSAPVTKRFDKYSATELYVGKASVGTLESASGWSINKITFDINGNATAVLYAVGVWDSRLSLTYT